MNALSTQSAPAPGIIPGLLQSEGYVHALLSECEGVWWEPNTTEMEDRLIYREQRQHRILDSSDHRIMRFVISEDSLHANLGDPAVMRGQLKHLLDLMRGHRDLSIRILRSDAAGNPSRGRGFWIFGFGDRGGPVGYSESAYGPSTYYDDAADMAAMRRAFYRIWEISLSKNESRRLMDSILKE